MPDDNLVLPGASDGILSPPLVSLVLIGWNYASFIGAAIESIKRQDYPWFEAIVVDNGSTDESREVIAQHVAGDSRFRVIHLEKNLGQLGAFLDVFEEIRGEFVLVVDADDVLFCNFLSSHIQVHLALPFSVGLTSSNIVEMTSTGRAITGGYASFDPKLQPDSRGLRRPSTALRLSTISEIDYRQLSDATKTFVHAGGWIWAPGTSNVFRRSVLKLVHHKPKDRTYFRATDNYLCPFCHVFGGSALIDKPLSAYRVHDNNYFAERESIHNVSMGRQEITKTSRQLVLETLGILFARAEFFQSVLPGERFWTAADQLSTGITNRRGKIVAYSDGATPFSDNYKTLKRVFGENALLGWLAQRLRLNALHTVLRVACDGEVPLRLRVRLVIEHARSTVRSLLPRPLRPGRLMQHAKSIVRATVPMQKYKFARQLLARPAEETANAIGPAAILSFNPPILYSGIAFDEYVGIAPTFAKHYGALPAAFIIYPCWSIDDELRAGHVIEAARKHQESYPAHELVFVCNTAGERDRLRIAGLNAHLLNKNFTVSETIFRPLPDAKVEFDAVYNARFNPRKRHELASRIPRVAYISYATGLTGTYDDQRARLADTLARRRDHALLNPVHDGLPVSLSPEGVNKELSRAAVGLCLSRIEGSNYASMEYMLAGLPVVSTPSLGGRDVYFDHEVCTICDPDPVSVQQAVQNMRARNLSPQYVRERALAKIEPERRRFLSLIDDLSEQLGGKRRYQDGVWPFGDTSGLAAFKTYREHLDDFAKGREAPPQNNRLPSLADIETLLTRTEGVQMQPEEVLAIVRAIKSRPGCALLVFGCGNDSPLWEDVNQSGTTAFIEDDPDWAERVRAKLRRAEVYLTEYGTRLSEWVSLLDATNRLDLDLPQEVMSRRWDVILVDGPPGHDNFKEYAGREAPGRMKSIFTASKLVAPGGAVFVHDCDRPAEQQYANKYLGSQRLFVSVKGRALLQGYAF